MYLSLWVWNEITLGYVSEGKIFTIPNYGVYKFITNDHNSSNEPVINNNKNWIV